MFSILVQFNFSVFHKPLVNTVTICMVYGKGSHKSNQQDAACFVKFYINEVTQNYFILQYVVYFSTCMTHNVM